MSALTKWTRPEKYEDIKPYDIQAVNEKLSSEMVEKAKRINDAKERILAKQMGWDALEMGDKND
ncbi:MAG: hypothetical protein COW76_20415 [Shewanella sp. CG18_big_fil_WC_8_21_14_2_50_42_11]|uniref:hypothetical protein n=1 Tax=Shewanella sp. CG18_big_fil_WC_8_21_14_2_50_42_11 TaxID=1975538 RepID=UPI000C53C598|nr:hypothetical protein [Shewanella sp. CG18_big_fil_WC_8_21_14_2_50_42_11]PIP98528.1 MAG: hypothetical protein COW76_20415 [Shewanella sp. CG18_big_fil_WC_8_21_14_2_50_42_11]